MVSTTLSNVQQVSWEIIAEEKRLQCYQQIPPEWRLPSHYTDRVTDTSVWDVRDVPRTCGILSTREVEITENFDAVALVAAIRECKFTSEEVAIAFCKRAAVAGQLTRCLTETFFDDAIARAKDLDKYLETTKKVKGPLHGLPISLKDSFNVTGVQTTVGYVSFVGNPPKTTNSPLVDLLLDLGAVLYVKTNLPQTQMSPESMNNVFGRVLNPHNLSWGPGGSSGGEGALVSMRGSILGVGTDVAGSIRIPSLSCGVFGFKPTSSRVPYGGQGSGGRKGNPGIQACAGPLATSFRDLRFFMETVIGGSPWNYDVTALAIPWRKINHHERPLVLGCLSEEDPAYPFHPPVIRALNSAVQTLQQAGHTVKKLQKVPSISDAVTIAFQMFNLDTENTAMQHVVAGGESPIQSLETSNMTFPGQTFTLDSLFAMNQARNKFMEDWQKVWLDNELDAIIMPGHRKTAGPHESYGHPPYTLIWNFADSPACIIPYEKADASRDINDRGLADYNAEIVHGAPCAIQVVGRRYQDEELLSAAEEIASVLKVKQ
ncbi:amidase [Talaromyces proteolyticus]|uniref:amidase n=1 Tax=Talaromyces proteolyticus TaxID=1131652 RepID=A0AAD4L8C5_9EURO|nr:amidase [Talaromyces proteolyticus]KAH8705769.1 amidase [Talaromyces proteolyticus]